MKPRNIIGKTIKTIRKQKALTQEQLTARLNVLGIDIDRPMLSKMENQSREIVDSEILALSKALDVSIEELFRERT